MSEEEQKLLECIAAVLNGDEPPEVDWNALALDIGEIELTVGEKVFRLTISMDTESA